MTLKIRYKIFIAIMATAIFIVFALQLILRHNFEQGLRHYSASTVLTRLDPISLALTEKYAEQGSWQFIRGSKTLPLGKLLNTSPNSSPLNRNGSQRVTPSFNREATSSRILANLSILDAESAWVAGAPYSSDLRQRNATKELSWNGKTIGYLSLAPLNRFTQQIDQRFSQQQNSTRIWTSFIILFAVLLSSFLISRNLGKPIKHLNEHVARLSDGDYDTKMSIGRRDELGSLATNVNRLADTLRRTRDQRRQWISDISHELRTPISVLRAEMECIEDGLQPITRETISHFKSEVERLNALVDDLHQLTQADHGNLTINLAEVDLSQEIARSIKAHQDQFKQKRISIETDLTGLTPIVCDPNRLRQVINNLLQNTLRYTDPPGKLTISGHALADQITLSFEDSAPGVPAESTHRLFDRLYRVDPSRSRKTGASGLGLSICAAIIKAHHGNISAGKSPLGGLAVHIELPITQTNVA